MLRCISTWRKQALTHTSGVLASRLGNWGVHLQKRYNFAKRYSRSAVQHQAGAADVALEEHPAEAVGVVLSSQANYYRVRLPKQDKGDDQGVELLCKMRSLLRKKGLYILVGDRVRVMGIDWQDARGLICDVFPRKTEILNPKVANVDHFALVFSLRDPPLEPFQVTRFLLSAASVGVTCTLILNKADLVENGVIERQVAQFRDWGYDAVPASVFSDESMKRVRDALVDRITVLAGPSGVGKSSIINCLRRDALDVEQQARLQVFEQLMAEEQLVYGYAPDAAVGISCEDSQDGEHSRHVDGHGGRPDQDAAAGQGSHPQGQSSANKRVASRQAAWKQQNADIYGAQAVSNVGFRSRRGRHTTRSAVLLEMPAGGLVVDTPGFNYPALDQVTVQTLPSLFPEVERLSKDQNCRFADCSHIHEPGCVVRGRWERYQFYVRIRDELLEREEIEATKLQMGKKRRQGNTKRLKGRGGGEIEIAKLDTKKHRKLSRTAHKVQVREMLEDATEIMDEL